MRTHFEVPGTAVVEVCLLSVYASFQICLTLESSGGVLTSGQHCSSAAAAYQVPATEYFLLQAGTLVQRRNTYAVRTLWKASCVELSIRVEVAPAGSPIRPDALTLLCCSHVYSQNAHRGKKYVLRTNLGGLVPYLV